MTVKKQYFGILLAICLAGCVLVASCLGGSSLFSKTRTLPEPETGITSWISAVNDRNFDRIYDLAPRSIKQQISLQEFLAAQRDNPLLAQGTVIQGFSVLNKTASGNDAAITAQITIHMPASVNRSGQDISVFLKFVEIFEDGEWHVWTTAPF
jgi:hypothetical protein